MSRDYSFFPVLKSIFDQNLTMGFKFILVIWLGGLLLSCDPDDPVNTNIPSVVLNVFQVRFPEAVEPDWEQINTNYGVKFEISGIDHKALIDPKGSVLQHKYEIGMGDLPREVKKVIKATYGLTDVDDIEKLNFGGELYYQIGFDRIFNDEEVVFNSSGEVMTKIPYWDN